MTDWAAMRKAWAARPLARPGERLAGRSPKALRRRVAAYSSRRVSARARLRARIASSSTAGPDTGVRSPACPSWALYFTNHHHILVERTTESCADLVQHRMSDATVLKASEHLATCIAPSTEAVKGLLRDAEVLPMDEAGRRVRGKVAWAACRLHRASDVV
jgi:hypothetical protein